MIVIVSPLFPAAAACARYRHVCMPLTIQEQFTMSPLESEDDKCMYSFGVSLAIDTDQFRKVCTCAVVF